MLRGIRPPTLMGSSMPAGRIGNPPLLSGLLPAGGPALEQLKREADRLMERQQTSQQASEALRIKLAEREQRCAALKEQLSKVQGENAGLRSSIRDGERQIGKVQEEMTIVQNRHHSLAQAAKALDVNTHKVESHRVALSQAFNVRFQKCEELESRVIALANTHTKLTNELTVARQSLLNANEAGGRLQEEHGVIQRKLQETVAALHEVESERARLAEELHSVRTALQQEVARLETWLSEKKNKIEAMTKADIELRAQHDAACAELTSRLQAAEQRIAELDAAAYAAAQLHEVDTQQKAEAQANIVKLEGWLSDTQQEALMLRADMQERTERHAVEVSQLRVDKDELDVNLADAKSRLDQLASDVAESRAALDQSKKDATEALAAAELSSKQALRKADAHLDDWKERVAGTHAQEMSVVKDNAAAEAKELEQKARLYEDAFARLCMHTLLQPAPGSEVAACARSQVASAVKATADKAAELEAAHDAAMKSLQVDLRNHAASASEKEELQKQVAEARATCETHLKSLQEAQATAANEAKSLHDKATALTADLEAAKAGHAEEFERLKTEADAQKDAAVAALRAELEGRLAEQTKKLTAAQDMLRGAATHTAELEEALEVAQGKLQKTEDKTDELEAALKETEANLIAKEKTLCHIGNAAHLANAGSPSDGTEKRPSPLKSQRKHGRPTCRYEEEDQDEGSDEEVDEEPQPKRRAKPAPPRFRASPYRGHRDRQVKEAPLPLQQHYDSGAESDEDDASSGGSDMQAPRRRRDAPAGRNAYTEPQRSQGQAVRGGGRHGGGRKTMFSTMSAYTASDDDNGHTFKRKGNGGGRGGGVTSSASLLKQKGGGVKKPAKAPASQDTRHKARGALPGKKRGGGSTAMNLFGNTDPYAFAASPY